MHIPFFPTGKDKKLPKFNLLVYNKNIISIDQEKEKIAMITQERVLEILKEAGVLLEGHFRLTSGRHSNKYLQCAKIFRNTKYSEELCGALAEQYQNDGVEVVIRAGDGCGSDGI